jgi:hypothetical protein
MHAQVAVNKTGWPDRTVSKRHPRLAKIHTEPHRGKEVAALFGLTKSTAPGKRILFHVLQRKHRFV